MSNEQQKMKRAERLQQKDNYIKKQVSIAKSHGFPVKNGDEHRLAKHSATTCGDPNCAMCGNPRKFFNEKTVQEQSFEQTGKWTEE